MSRRGWVLFGALSVIWGVPYLFIRVAVEHVSPAVLVCGRTALGCLVLAPVAVRGRMVAPVLARARWVIAFAALEIVGPFGLLSWAEVRLSSSITGLLVSGVPLIGAVAGVALRLPDRIRLADPADRGRLVGLVVGLAGVAALVGIDLRGGDVLAALAVLGAAVGYAVAPVLATRRLGDLPSLGVSTVAMGTSALVYLPFAIATRPRAAVPWRAWASIGVLGVVCSALAFLVFFALIAEVGPGRATVITYLNPVVAVAFGVALLGEPVTGGMLVGFPLVILGAWLATRRSASVTPSAGSVTPSRGTPSARRG